MGQQDASEFSIRRLAGGVAYTGLGNVSTMFFGLAGAMVVARRIAPEDYGTFVLIQVMASFLARCTSFGLNSALPTYLADPARSGIRSGLINASLLLQGLKLPVVALLMLLGRGPVLGLFHLPSRPEMLWLVLLVYAVESFRIMVEAAQQSLLHFRPLATAKAIAAVLGLILLLVFVGLAWGLAGLVYARVLSSMAGVVYGYLRLPQTTRIRIEVAELWRVIRFGAPLQVNDVFTFLFQRLDTLMVGALLGPAAIAVYEIARKIPDSLSNLYTSFVSVFYPFMARQLAQGDRRGATRMLEHSLRFVSLTTAFGAVVAVAYGDLVIRVLFSEKYLPSVPAFSVLMLALNLTFVDAVLGFSIVASGDSQKPALINVVHSAFSLAATWLLTPRFSVAGAAWATALGYAVANPLAVLFLRRRGIRVPVSGYLAPLGLLAGCWLVRLTMPQSATWECGLLIILFAAGCLALGVIRPQELRSAWFGLRGYAAERMARRSEGKQWPRPAQS